VGDCARSAGQGIVLAAWSRTPFSVDRYAKDGRWDLNALSGQGAQTDGAEARLMDIVDAMRALGGHFDYDVAVYTVSAPPRYALTPYGYPYGWPGYWGYNAWWGYGPPFLSTRIFVPFGRVGIGGQPRLPPLPHAVRRRHALEIHLTRGDYS
jgi:hypothetical protein